MRRSKYGTWSFGVLYLGDDDFTHAVDDEFGVEEYSRLSWFWVHQRSFLISEAILPASASAELDRRVRRAEPLRRAA